MPPRPASLKVRALQWLAQREHSRNELRDKLLRLLQGYGTGRGTSTSTGDDAAAPSREAAALEVETLLQWLEARAYLSDARFVESRLRTRQSRYGNLRIQQELRQHGLSLDADSREALQQSELDRARALWSRRYTAPPSDAAARLRQMRFLAWRGFSLDVVRRVVGRSGAGADPSDGEESPFEEA